MRIFGILVGSMAALGLATVIAAHAGPYGDQLGGGQVVDRSATADIAANLTASAWRAGQIWPEAEIDDMAHIDLLLADNNLSADAISQLAATAPAFGPKIINPDDAMLALRRLSSDAISVLKGGQLDAAHRVAKFHGLMSRDFDIPLMARFALGRIGSGRFSPGVPPMLKPFPPSCCSITLQKFPAPRSPALMFSLPIALANATSWCKAVLPSKAAGW